MLRVAFAGANPLPRVGTGAGRLLLLRPQQRNARRRGPAPASVRPCTPRMHGRVWDAAPHSPHHYGSAHGVASGDDRDHNNDHDHDHDHEHDRNHGDEHKHGHDNRHGYGHGHHSVETPLATLLALLDTLRHSVRAAVVGAALLAVAAVAGMPVPARPAVLLLPQPARAAALGACLALTGLPALAEVAQRLVASRGRDLDTDALMALAAMAALAAGAAAEAALLTTLYALSHAVEHAVITRARADLDTLHDLAPQVAWRVPPEDLTTATPERVLVADIRVDDHVLVRQGEIVPCDAVVANGTAFVVVQHLTGESTPRPVSQGDNIMAGARLVDAPLVVRVSRVGAESTLARISRLVTSAQANRPRVTRFFDRYSRMYTRTILSIAALLVTALPLFAGMRMGGTNGSMKRSLGFLVAASPCALVIGAPVAYLSSLSACARRGVLVKSGPRALDATAGAKHVVFDKTGTLTTGNLAFVSALALPSEHSWQDQTAPAVDTSRPLRGEELHSVLTVAAALERGAVHPVALALSNKVAELKLRTSHLHVERLTTVPGQGAEATLRNSCGAVTGLDVKSSVSTIPGLGSDIADTARVGRMSYVIPGRPWLKALRDRVSNGGELLVSALQCGDNRYLLLFRDQVREEAAAGVASLRSQGLSISILTGDGIGSARLVKRSVGGVDEVIANATPEGKLEYVRALQRRASRDEAGGVIMVGDGVNDAPALATATVGIVCGLSSATAVQSADVVLVRTDLRDVAWYIQKASTTQTIVKQNLAIALILMLIAVACTLSGAAPLWMAVVLHEGGTVLVGLNGLRLLSDSLS